MNNNQAIKRNVLICRVFNKKGNEDLLIDFLESLLNIKIKKIEITSSEIPDNNIYGKLNIKATLYDEEEIQIKAIFDDDIQIIKNKLEKEVFYIDCDRI